MYEDQGKLLLFCLPSGNRNQEVRGGVAGNYRSAVEVLTVWQVLVTFQSLPGPTSAYQELPSGFCSEQYSFLRGSVGCDRLLWGQIPETALPLKPELRLGIWDPPSWGARPVTP